MGLTLRYLMQALCIQQTSHIIVTRMHMASLHMQNVLSVNKETNPE